MIKFFKFTKKKLKLVQYRYNWTNQSYNGWFKYKPRRYKFFWKKVPKIYKLYKYFLLNRQILRFFFCHVSHRTMSRFHKHMFKKSKKRLYLQSFWLTFERRVATVLFQSRMLSKIKFMKQFVLHRRLLINGEVRSTYFTQLNPLDFVHIRIPLTQFGYKTSIKYNKNIKNSSINNYGVMDTKTFLFYRQVRRVLKIHLKSCSSLFLTKLRRRYFFSKRNYFFYYNQKIAKKQFNFFVRLKKEILFLKLTEFIVILESFLFFRIYRSAAYLTPQKELRPFVLESVLEDSIESYDSLCLNLDIFTILMFYIFFKF